MLDILLLVNDTKHNELIIKSSLGQQSAYQVIVMDKQIENTMVTKHLFSLVINPS